MIEHAHKTTKDVHVWKGYCGCVFDTKKDTEEHEKLRQILDKTDVCMIVKYHYSEVQEVGFTLRSQDNQSWRVYRIAGPSKYYYDFINIRPDFMKPCEIVRKGYKLIPSTADRCGEIMNEALATIYTLTENRETNQEIWKELIKRWIK